MGCVTTRLQIEIKMPFFCPWPWRMQGNWKHYRNSFWWSANQEKFRENDWKKVVKNSEIFPRKYKKILVVREPRQNLSSGPRVAKGWEPLL